MSEGALRCLTELREAYRQCWKITKFGEYSYYIGCGCVEQHFFQSFR